MKQHSHSSPRESELSSIPASSEAPNPSPKLLNLAGVTVAGVKLETPAEDLPPVNWSGKHVPWSGLKGQPSSMTENVVLVALALGFWGANIAPWAGKAIVCTNDTLSNCSSNYNTTCNSNNHCAAANGDEQKGPFNRESSPKPQPLQIHTKL